MANPTDSRTLADVASAAVDAYLPGVIDLFFGSNPLLIRLVSKEQVVVEGGDQIRQSILYDDLTADSYTGVDTLSTERVPTKTVMQFDWAQYYVNLTIDGRTLLKAGGGGTKVIDLVETEMETARLSLANRMGTDLFLDGTGNSNKNLLGLIAGVDDGTNVLTYGGISRDSSVQGTSVKGNLNTTGGVLSLPLVNTAMGSATIQPHRPDLIVGPQAMWDRFWERITPQHRDATGPGFDDIGRAGYSAINFNGAAVVIDSHAASGNLWLLNTDWVKLVVHEDRQFTFGGFMTPTNQDVMTGKIFWAGQLIVCAPRLQTRMTGLS